MINVSSLEAQFDYSSSFTSLSEQEVREDLEFLLTSIEDIHPAPYKWHPKKEWLELIEESARIKGPINLASVYSHVLRIISLANDGHMDAYTPDDSKVKDAIPAKFVVFTEGVFVVAATPELKHLIRAQLLEIEGLPIRDVIEKIGPIVPSDNDWGKKELIEDYLRMPHLLSAIGVENDQVEWQLTVKKDNETRIFNLALENLTNDLPAGPPRRPLPARWLDCRDYEEDVTPLWQKNLDKNFWFEIIQGSIPDIVMATSFVLEEEVSFSFENQSEQTPFTIFSIGNLLSQNDKVLEVFNDQLIAFNNQDVQRLVQNVSEDFKNFYITSDELVIEVEGKEPFKKNTERILVQVVK